MPCGKGVLGMVARGHKRRRTWKEENGESRILGSCIDRRSPSKDRRRDIMGGLKPNTRAEQASRYITEAFLMLLDRLITKIHVTRSGSSNSELMYLLDSS